MSAIDLRGLRARVDRWDSMIESLEGRRVEVSRLRWLGTLLVAPLLVVPMLWADQDPADREAVLAPFSAGGPPIAALSLERTPEVEGWLRTFKTSRRREFDRLLGRRGRYEALIRTKLRERGMPEELVYVPMIESDFSTYAVSPVAAVGLWQFMAPTAIQYGLRVDEWVDERRDPVRATDAALDYIEWLNRRFDGSWNLTVAAFNAGPGRTGRIVRRHGEGRSDDDMFWDVLEHLPSETQDYVPKLIAFSLLANQALSDGHPESELVPYRYESVFVPGGTHLSAIASLLGIDQSELRVLNPHLTRGITPPGEVFGVRVPVGKAAVVVDALTEAIAD